MHLRYVIFRYNRYRVKTDYVTDPVLCRDFCTLMHISTFQDTHPTLSNIVNIFFSSSCLDCFGLPCFTYRQLSHIKYKKHSKLTTLHTYTQHAPCNINTLCLCSNNTGRVLLLIKCVWTHTHIQEGRHALEIHSHCLWLDCKLFI